MPLTYLFKANSCGIAKLVLPLRSLMKHKYFRACSTDLTKPFEIETDACEVGIGAFLIQNGHPITYLSKALTAPTCFLSTYEKEKLVFMTALKKWMNILTWASLCGMQTTIASNTCSLKESQCQINKNG